MGTKRMYEAVDSILTLVSFVVNGRERLEKQNEIEFMKNLNSPLPKIRIKK